MDTSPALDTFFLINHTDAILVISNSVYRTYLFTGTFQMGNRTVRTCLCTFSTFLTLIGVYVSTTVFHGDSPKITRILACLSHTFPAVVCHYIGCNRTFLTGSIDNLNYIDGIFACRTFSFCQTNSLFNNLSFFIDTAAKLSLRAWEHFVRQFFSLLFQLSLPCQLCHLTQHIMLNP